MMGTIRRSEEECNLMLEVPAGPERLAATAGGGQRLDVGLAGPGSAGGLEPRQARPQTWEPSASGTMSAIVSSATLSHGVNFDLLIT